MSTNNGKQWYNNGKINKMFLDGQQPADFVKGMLPNLSKVTIKGRKQYNNGRISKFFSSDEEIPEGFVLGPLPDQVKRLQKFSSNQKGVEKSATAKQNMSDAAKRRFSNPENHPFYGKHHTQETRDKISAANKTREPRIPKGYKYSEEEKAKLKQTKIDKYGSIEEFNRVSVLHNKQSKLKNHGEANYTNVEKRQKTISEIPNFYENRNKKSYDTIIKRYQSVRNWWDVCHKTRAINAGYKSVAEYNKAWRDKLNQSKKSMTKLERRFADFLITNKIAFDTQYLIKSQELQHTFDFAIYDKDANISVLVDCDGVYFHGYDSDETGKLVNTYVDDYRSLLVPENVKFVVIVETQEETGYNEFLRCFNMSLNDYKQDIFHWCRDIKFPFPHYSEKVVKHSFESLISASYEKFTPKARYGEKVLLNYFPSIYFANKRNKLSPYEAWNNDELLKRCIDNRVIYKGATLDPSKVLAGFSASGIAPKVSIFNPYLAKYLITKYLSNYATIFDPFSGFGGRLLGAIACNKIYIGQDINSTVVTEANNMITELGFVNCSVTTKDVMTSKGSYEALFTCSPYSLKEIWSKETKLLDNSCDEWIDICLTNFDCNRYVFVVDNTVKYQKFIVENIKYKSHFTECVEKVVVIDKDQVTIDAHPNAMAEQGDNNSQG